MQHYRQLQTKLKALKAAGKNVRCKLNAPSAILAYEYNRITGYPNPLWAIDAAWRTKFLDVNDPEISSEYGIAQDELVGQSCDLTLAPTESGYTSAPERKPSLKVGYMTRYNERKKVWELVKQSLKTGKVLKICLADKDLSKLEILAEGWKNQESKPLVTGSHCIRKWFQTGNCQTLLYWSGAEWACRQSAKYYTNAVEAFKALDLLSCPEAQITKILANEFVS